MGKVSGLGIRVFKTLAMVLETFRNAKWVIKKDLRQSI